MKNPHDPTEPQFPKRYYEHILFWPLVALSIVAAVAGYYAVWGWIMAPKVNPNPQKKMEVRGVFPYDKGLDLVIRQQFHSTNPKCKYTARAFFIFEMAEVSRTEGLDVPVVREGENRYSFISYEDYFEPGYCEWRSGGLSQEYIVNNNIKPFTGPNKTTNLLPGNRIGGNSLFGLHRNFNVIHYTCYFVEREDEKFNKVTVERYFTCRDGDERPTVDPSKSYIELNFNAPNKIERIQLVPGQPSKNFFVEGVEE